MEWIDKELSAFKDNENNAKIAFFKMDNNIIYTIKIDFSKAFEKKIDRFDDYKAWIPIEVKEKDEVVNKIWTLNTANPFYRELLSVGKMGQTEFKIIKTGSGELTRIALVK